VEDAGGGVAESAAGGDKSRISRANGATSGVIDDGSKAMGKRKWFPRSSASQSTMNTDCHHPYRITKHEAKHSRSKLRLVNSEASLCAERNAASASTVRLVTQKGGDDAAEVEGRQIV
jgi:hypothetical protein